MTPADKKVYLSKIILDNKEVEITRYGNIHLKCYPVRLLGNILNYKLTRSVKVDGKKYAKVNSINISEIHKMEEI